MDTQTTLLLFALGATGLAIVKRISRRPPDFLATLKAFKCDPSWRESTFHKELRKHLEESLASGPLEKVMTEAGVTGTTVRVDLHALYGATDYLITVKKGLSAQKLKTLVGEVTQILTHWRGTEGRKTVMVVVLYGDGGDGGGDDHVHALAVSMQSAQALRPDIPIELAASEPRESVAA